MSLMRYGWLLAAVFLLSSCHDEMDLPPALEQRVVVVYMIAENSLSSYAASDLSEMRRAVGNIPDNCTLAVYLDDSHPEPGPRILTFDNKRGERTLYEYKEDPISTDSASMQQALDFIIGKCPARHYGLVLWSHGSGWIPQRQQAARHTIGVDNGKNSGSNTGTELEIPTLAHILAQTGQRWDYVFFDACFMQGIEVAYELRNVADWVIGSPAEIPGWGAPYDHIMPNLFAEPEEVWTIARDYHNYYLKDYGQYLTPVLSCVNTAELEQLASATAAAVAGLDAPPAIAKGIQEYGGYDNRSASGQAWFPHYYDMGSAMAKWLDGEAYQAWLESLNRAVPYRYAARGWQSVYTSSFVSYLPVTDAEHLAAVSMYIPGESNAQDAHYSRFEWHKAIGW